MRTEFCPFYCSAFNLTIDSAYFIVIGLQRLDLAPDTCLVRSLPQAHFSAVFMARFSECIQTDLRAKISDFLQMGSFL
jgi:hypothetical protein